MPEGVEDIHKHTKQCRQDMQEECQYACRYCHGEPWQPISFSDIDSGDLKLCTQCHDWKSDLGESGSARDCLPRHHQENVDYEVNEEARLSLKEQPRDIKLFCNKEQKCKVFCISCHMPMEEPGERLRTPRMAQHCIRCHSP